MLGMSISFMSLINLFNRPDTVPSYRLLKHKTIVAMHYKKFQKYEKALEYLMPVYKEQLKLYNATYGKTLSSLLEEDAKEEPAKSKS